MSSDPRFEVAAIRVEGRTVSAYKCTCKKCGAEDKIPANRQTHRLPGVVVQKKFQQRGWAFPKRLCRECK